MSGEDKLSSFTAGRRPSQAVSWNWRSTARRWFATATRLYRRRHLSIAGVGRANRYLRFFWMQVRGDGAQSRSKRNCLRIRNIEQLFNMEMTGRE